MVTGVETAGLVLAILPLLVNQLDSYVQGLQTIKSFRSRQFRRELDGYCTMLGTQQAILLNTLEEALEGIVDHEDEIRELMSNPNATLWGDPSFRAELRKKLRRDYTAFNRLMFELSQELQDLSRNLGLDRNASFKVGYTRPTLDRICYLPPPLAVASLSLISNLNANCLWIFVLLVILERSICRRARSHEIQDHLLEKHL
jgi:hypothetical protein